MMAWAAMAESVAQNRKVGAGMTAAQFGTIRRNPSLPGKVFPVE